MLLDVLDGWGRDSAQGALREFVPASVGPWCFEHTEVIGVPEFDVDSFESVTLLGGVDDGVVMFVSDVVFDERSKFNHDRDLKSCAVAQWLPWCIVFCTLVSP